MSPLSTKESKRVFRHKRIRRRLAGTPQCPRLCVHRSLNNIYAQIVDDTSGKVLFGMSTLTKNVKSKLKNGGNKNAAQLLGEIFSSEAQKKGIKQVRFDRGGYVYHGRVQTFAEAARKGGLEF